MAPRGPQDSVFKSSGHITGASGFSPKTWPGKILLMSWTWYLGWSRMVPKGPNNWDICGNIMEYIYIMKKTIYLSLSTYIPTYLHSYLHTIALHCITLRYVTLRYITLHACMHAYIHTYIHFWGDVCWDFPSLWDIVYCIPWDIVVIFEVFVWESQSMWYFRYIFS